MEYRPFAVNLSKGFDKLDQNGDGFIIESVNKLEKSVLKAFLAPCALLTGIVRYLFNSKITHPGKNQSSHFWKNCAEPIAGSSS